MFIHHQTRRITRTTRTATAKDNENANARPSRITTRAKPSASSAATTAAGGTSRATAGTAASRAKIIGSKDVDATAGKRKREALGEVTALVTNNKPAPKGKDKADSKKEKFDGVVIKSKAPAPRQPLRTVATTRQAAKVTTAAVTKKTPLEDVPEVAKAARPKVINIADDNAMAVDPPAQTLPSITVRKSVVSQEVAAAATRRSEGHRRTSARSYTATRQRTVEDAEAGRVFKKRRTSSDAPQDDLAVTEEAQQLSEEEAAAARLAAEIEAYAEEPEAHPEDSKWDDLDAGDADDPLMVSDYVVEIFEYLQQVEVITLFTSQAPNSTINLAYHYAESKLHGLPERARMEDAWHLDRLANPGSRSFPPSSRDTLSLCQHH